MTASIQKPIFRTISGETLSVMAGTEHPVPVDEMVRRRDAWRAQHKHLLGDYSSAEFLKEKHRDVEAGLE